MVLLQDCLPLCLRRQILSASFLPPEAPRPPATCQSQCPASESKMGSNRSLRLFDPAESGGHGKHCYLGKVPTPLLHNRHTQGALGTHTSAEPTSPCSVYSAMTGTVHPPLPSCLCQMGLGPCPEREPPLLLLTVPKWHFWNDLQSMHSNYTCKGKGWTGCFYTL